MRYARRAFSQAEHYIKVYVGLNHGQKVQKTLSLKNSEIQGKFRSNCVDKNLTDKHFSFCK